MSRAATQQLLLSHQAVTFILPVHHFTLTRVFYRTNQCLCPIICSYYCTYSVLSAACNTGCTLCILLRVLEVWKLVQRWSMYRSAPLYIPNHSCASLTYMWPVWTCAAAEVLLPSGSIKCDHKEQIVRVRSLQGGQRFQLHCWLMWTVPHTQRWSCCRWSVNVEFHTQIEHRDTNTNRKTAKQNGGSEPWFLQCIQFYTSRRRILIFMFWLMVKRAGSAWTVQFNAAAIIVQHYGNA